MTPKKFYDWQTSGGTNDVMALVNCLEGADILWCAIGGVAVNHWADQTMVTQDVDIVLTFTDIERAMPLFADAGFSVEQFDWSINLKGSSDISIQISTEEFYRTFPERSVPADVYGILIRVASLEDTLSGKMRAWSDASRRQSKRIKDLADIVRMVETHPHLWDQISAELKEQVQHP